MPNLVLLNAPGPQGAPGQRGPKGDIGPVGPVGPSYTFNAKDFGMLPTNSATANMAGWQALLAAANIQAQADYPSSAGNFNQLNALQQIYISPGTYQMSGPLYLNRGMRLFSDNMGQWAQGYEALGTPSTALIFPKGSAGIVIETLGTNYDTNNPSPHPTNTSGKYSLIENINIFGGWTGADVGQAGGVPVWGSGIVYSAGDVVIPSYFLKYGYAYKARNGGTSGANEPVWATAAQPFPAPTYSCTDNGITWDLIRADGIIINDICTVRRCRIVGFAGNGVAAFADVGFGNGANGVIVDECFLGYNGGSAIAIAGGDTNACQTRANILHHCGGYGLYDFAPLGNTHTGNQSAGHRAGGYLSRSSTLIQPYSEAGDGPVILGSDSLLLKGTIGDGFRSGNYYPDWTLGHFYSVNDIILETTSGQYWIVAVSGTSSGSRPNFTNNAGGPFGRDPFGTRSFVSDNGVKWLAYSEATDACAPTWRASRAYPTGSIVRATGTSGHAFVNNGPQFTSGTGEPIWNTTSGATTSDNGGTWTELGRGTTLSTAPSIASAGSLGCQTLEVVVRSDAVTKRLDLGTAHLSGNLLSWTSDDQPNDRFRLDWDSTNKYWTVNLNALSTNLHFALTGSGYTGPEGASQLLVPNGLWAGQFNDPTAPSYFGSTKIRFDGGRGVGGHYSGATDAVRDEILTSTTATTVAHTYTLADDVTYGALTEISVKVLAKDLSAGEMATFMLRGSWFRKGASVTVVGAPEVVYGGPTDTSHCTAGATGYTAVLVLNGTNVEVRVTNGGHQTHWYVFREAAEGARL